MSLSATLHSVANNWPSIPAAKTGSPPVCPCRGDGCGRSVTTLQDLHILPAQSNRQYCRVAITNALAGVVVAGADPGMFTHCQPFGASVMAVVGHSESFPIPHSIGKRVSVTRISLRIHHNPKPTLSPLALQPMRKNYPSASEVVYSSH